MEALTMSDKSKMCFGCGENHADDSGLCETCEAKRERTLNGQDQEVRVSRSFLNNLMTALGILFAFIMM